MHICLFSVVNTFIVFAFKLDHVYLRHLSTEYRSILSVDMSAESRPIYRPILGWYVGRDSVDISTDINRHACRPTPGRYFTATRPPLIRYLSDTSCITYVFEMAAVWATSSFYQHTSIGDRCNLLVRWRLLFQQNISINTPIYTTDSRPIHHRQSTDTPATVDRNISTEVSAECRPTYRPIVSTDSLLTWTTCRPTLGQHIDRVSVDISAEIRPTCRPRVSTDTRSTDALSTHDPLNLLNVDHIWSFGRKFEFL